MDFNYNVYDNGELMAGFMSLCTAVVFMEGWGRSLDLVDPKTAEVLDTWDGKKWVGGRF